MREYMQNENTLRAIVDTDLQNIVTVYEHAHDSASRLMNYVVDGLRA